MRVDEKRVQQQILKHKNWKGFALPGVIYGLGEVMAHTVGGFDAAAYFALLRRWSKRPLIVRKELFSLLKAAQLQAQRKSPPGPAVVMAYRDALREDEFTTEVLAFSHVRDMLPPPMYGLYATCNVALIAAPEVLGDWLKRKATAWAATAVFNNILRELTWGLNLRQQLPLLLRTRRPVLQLLAVDAWMAEIFKTEELSGRLTLLANLLRQPHIPADHAFALATVAFNRVRLQRLTLVDRINIGIPKAPQSHPFITLPPFHRPTLLPTTNWHHNVETAPSFAGEDSRDELSRIENLADQALDLIAEHLLSSKLTPSQIELLKKCFIGDQSQFFVRLAQRIPVGVIKQKMIEQAINVIKELLLPSSTTDSFNLQLSQHEDFPKHLSWLRRALVLLQSDGVGPAHLSRQMGLLLGPPSKKADEVLYGAYAANRDPERYASALQHRLFGVWLALQIAAGDTNDGLQPLPELMQKAVEAASKVLKLCRGDIDDRGWQFRVSLLVVELMANSYVQDDRASWVANESFPPLLRFLCAWSSPALVSQDQMRAVKLMRNALIDFTFRDDLEAVSMALEVLDIAISQSHTIGDSAIQAQVVQAWQAGLVRWSPGWSQHLQPAATALQQALHGDPSMRDRLLASSDFGKSRCALLLRASDAPPI